MFVLTVQLRVHPDRREEFLAAVAINAASSVRTEPGCRQFDVCADPTDGTRFLLYEVYEDPAAFEAHKQAPHFAEWRAAADVTVAEQVNTTYQLVSGSAAGRLEP